MGVLQNGGGGNGGDSVGDGDNGGAFLLEWDGETWTLNVQAFNSPLPECTINVNYGCFAEGSRKVAKIGLDVKRRCKDLKILLPSADLTFLT
ncbi:Hypothetical predicted protein [Olea europaea subsp. europaea]|uniref:Uncharacterized protein n=1 Tax=Olea europaea subsp. europaea TaxID=158383 RepID=A0A8S0PRS6_OLEEU|nr:Hypothetical predicted protein [Olea europaea subsp. europaea]